MLVDCERLSGNGRLIDLEESIIGYDAAISRNNSTLKFFLVLHKTYFQVCSFMVLSTYFFNLQNITRNNFWSLDFE